MLMAVGQIKHKWTDYQTATPLVLAKGCDNNYHISYIIYYHISSDPQTKSLVKVHTLYKYFCNELSTNRSSVKGFSFILKKS